MNQVFFCKKYIKETQSGQFVCKTMSFIFAFPITITQHKCVMQHFPFFGFEFSVHSASIYLAKMSSDESSDSEMTYDSSDEEVWEEEEVSRDDDSDGRPGFLDPTRWAHGLHVV